MNREKEDCPGGYNTPDHSSNVQMLSLCVLERA